MGLETAAFVDDLVETNPVGSTDDISKGDDHLRLIKAALKATFIGADKPFYFPDTETNSITANHTIVAADENKVIPVDTGGGNITISLTDAITLGRGFRCILYKNEAGNTITIDPSGSQTINGSSTYSFTIKDSAVELLCNGVGWWTRVTHSNNIGILADYEIDQLANIGATVISSAHWGYMAAADLAFTDELNDKITMLCWGSYDQAGTPNLIDSYNVSSITDQATGRFQVNINVDASTATYAVNATIQPVASDGPCSAAIHTNAGTAYTNRDPATGTFVMQIVNLNGTLVDAPRIAFTAHGGET